MLTRGRRATTRLATALLLVLTGILGTASSAHAAVQPCDNSYVCVVVGSPGSGGGSSGGGSGGGGGGGGSGACSYGGQILPCYIPGIGWLSANDGCYYIEMQPQPPAGDPLWQGNPPGTGAVYVRTCSLNAGGGTVSLWLPAAPATAPQVTPGELARLAVSKLPLHAAKVDTAPKADTKHSGLVGAPIWLWLDEKAGNYNNSWASAANPLTVTASVPGLSVTAYVSSPYVIWVMGDGHRKLCSGGLGAGIAYPGDAKSACTYTYQRPSKDYLIEAIVGWQVRWTSNTGATGAFRMNDIRTPAQQLRIEELQVLN
ncbi:hypothetical protein ABIA32_003181 [Streptacidiphilus sp. MAP12-20]|uniref:hypothetical protein n=1 Tax=Streptacidiphilus sp. MAP12-20 TaxID=3156299 RepID=UPI003514FB1D